MHPVPSSRVHGRPSRGMLNPWRSSRDEEPPAPPMAAHEGRRLPWRSAVKGLVDRHLAEGGASRSRTTTPRGASRGTGPGRGSGRSPTLAQVPPDQATVSCPASFRRRAPPPRAPFAGAACWSCPEQGRASLPLLLDHHPSAGRRSATPGRAAMRSRGHRLSGRPRPGGGGGRTGPPFRSFPPRLQPWPQPRPPPEGAATEWRWSERWPVSASRSTTDVEPAPCRRMGGARPGPPRGRRRRPRTPYTRKTTRYPTSPRMRCCTPAKRVLRGRRHRCDRLHHGVRTGGPWDRRNVGKPAPCSWSTTTNTNGTFKVPVATHVGYRRGQSTVPRCRRWRRASRSCGRDGAGRSAPHRGRTRPLKIPVGAFPRNRPPPSRGRLAPWPDGTPGRGRSGRSCGHSGRARPGRVRKKTSSRRSTDVPTRLLQRLHPQGTVVDRDEPFNVDAVPHRAVGTGGANDGPRPSVVLEPVVATARHR